MKKKKICFIATLPTTLESFVLPMTEYLHYNIDWDVYMICNNDKTFGKKLPGYIHYIPVKMDRGINISGIRSLIEMLKVFKREKFDMIQYSTPNASLYASIAGVVARVPVRLYCQWGMVYVGMQGFKRKIFKLEEKIVCKLSTWIEPDSKSNLDFSHKEKLYPKWKGSVVGAGSASGVNLEKFDISKKEKYRVAIREQLNIPELAYVFVFVGRVTKDKGINELYSAFRKILKCAPDCYLMIVGPEEGIETIDQRLYKWSKNEEHVLYVGETNAVEQYLSAADCFVLPSYREGFGLGTVEAEAMGLPVIVTNIPGPIDAMIPNRTGLIVRKESVSELYMAMKKMMDSDMSEFGRLGHQFVVDNFEQKKLFESILKDRKRLLSKKKGHS